MDEGFGYLILAVVVIGLIIAAIVALLYIGLFIIAGIAVVGAVAGCVVALKNFFAVLEEAHTAVPGPPGTSRRLYLTFAGVFVVVLALVAAMLFRQLARPQPGAVVARMPRVAAAENLPSGTGRSEVATTGTQWSGTFDQGGQKTQFEAVIESRAGSIEGTIRESATQGRTTQATLSGTTNGTSIAFQKRYPNGRVVSYSGTFTNTGNAASGKWSVDSLQGTWTMARVAPQARPVDAPEALRDDAAGTPPSTLPSESPGAQPAPPTRIRNVTPIYPAMAQAARVSGAVLIEATIGPDGKVQSARVLRSIPLLDQAALDAVRQWEYTPTLHNGEPVSVTMTVTVNFALQ
jgi:protein TonB